MTEQFSNHFIMITLLHSLNLTCLKYIIHIVTNNIQIIYCLFCKSFNILFAVSGKPSHDPQHPDYIPTRFGEESDRKDTSVRRYQSALKRRQSAQSESASKRACLSEQCTPQELVTPHGHKVPLAASTPLSTPVSMLPALTPPCPTPTTPQENVCSTPVETAAVPVNDISDVPFEESRIVDIDVNGTDDEGDEVLATPLDPSEAADHSSCWLEMDSLRHERDEAREERDHALAHANAARLTTALIMDNNDKAIFYTGIPWGWFLSLYTFLVAAVPDKGIPKVPYMEQLFLTLVKLKQDPNFEYLSDQAGIPVSTLTDYFWKWIDLIYYRAHIFIQPSARDWIYGIIPPEFKAKFPRLTNIIDCFEIFIEAPSNKKARAQTWSDYKRHTTVKYLISCNPLGAITFISEGWGGRASDNKIVRESGYIHPTFHMPGDQILADRGFTLKDDFGAICSAELLTPAFIKGQLQFSAQDVEQSRENSNVRIHIERVIGLVKNRFGILQGVLPLKLVKSRKDEACGANVAIIDKIVKCCCILSNLSGSIVYKK